MGSVIAKATTDNSPERKGGDESSSKREGAGRISRDICGSLELQ